MVSDSLLPLQSASGGPASQRNSTPTASVRMSEGQELIHASRIISDTVLLLDYGCAVAECLTMPDNCLVHWTESLQGPLRAQRVKNL